MGTNDSTSFAILLREHRLAAGLTQAMLADQAWLSLRGVSDLERGISVKIAASDIVNQAGDRPAHLSCAAIFLTVARTTRRAT